MVLEHRAGAADRAKAHLLEYLRSCAEANYARPLALDRAVARALRDDVADAPGTCAAVVAAELRDTLRDDAAAGTDLSDRG